MTRSERINKLAGAIKDYRGKYNAKTGKWIRTPNPAARIRVEIWSQRLGLDPAHTIAAADGFKSFEQFNAWVSKLSS